jgi:hypothetical protein
MQNEINKIDFVEDIAALELDPRAFVEFAFNWGVTPLDGVTVRKWQSEILEYIGSQLKNKETRNQPIQIAVASGHGIGKSSLISMICVWALSTMPDTKVIVTSNTENQLRTKTQPEIIKWLNLAINKDWFIPTATSIYSKEKHHEKTWRLDLVPWSENNTESFAGAHAKGRRIVIVFDEASSISDKIWEVATGALTDEDTQIIFLAFGNPTRASGRFRECFRKFSHRWKTWQIDSRDVEGTNKEELQKWVDDYGENSDFVKVRVRGMFPSQSAKQLISTEDVDNAYGKHLRDDQYNWAPKILTVDPSWEGDDETVIALRQGLAFKILRTIPKNDNDVSMANLIARIEDEENADAVFVDAGYGTGIVSVARTLGRAWQLVWFAEKPRDEGCLNKRAEMWIGIRDWLKAGGAIPKDPTLHAELTSCETVSRLDGKIQIEAKKDMKARGLTSPNRADALALSFAYPVQAKHKIGAGKHHHQADYDPFNEARTK